MTSSSGSYLATAPYWPALEALSHTLAYDTEITSSMSTERLSSIIVPTLVLDSAGTDDRLHRWAKGVAERTPNSTHCSLPGEWHGVAPDVLAPALTAFFKGEA